MNHFFVYGTLMQGLKYHYLIEPYVTDVQPAQIRGTLYHLSYGYPGLILDDKHEVTGEILRVNDLEKSLKVLDRLEDYYGPGHPDNHYERRIIKVNEFPCYVYEWILPLDGIGLRVPGQDWRAYMQKYNSLDI